MFNPSRDILFRLIKSLTKAEKRSFRLYVNRFSANMDPKFVQLFDVLDRLEEYDEQQLLSRLPEVEKPQLANLKRHLYQQILISLRLIHIKKNIDIQIREQLDFARILYGKGLYMQALKLLGRIKPIAVNHHQDLLHLEILEFEKTIEARHITRSRTVENKMETLLEETEKRSRVIYRGSLYSNFNIQIQGWFIQYGHAKASTDRKAIRAYYQLMLPKYGSEESLTFNERINLYQAKMWYHYILLDFPSARTAAKNWINLLNLYEQIRVKDPDLFIRGMYYLLLFYFLEEQVAEYPRYLNQFKGFIEEQQDQFNPNSQMLAQVYLVLSELNLHYLQGTYRKGLALVPKVEETIREYGPSMDEHRILVLYYKLAYLHFGCGEYEKAIDYLNRIILERSAFLREELHYFSALLYLVCLLELGWLDRIEYHLSAAKRAFNQAGELSSFQWETLKQIGKASVLPPGEVRPFFSGFSPSLSNFKTQPILQKERVFFDTPAWVESFIRKCTLEEWLASAVS